MSEPQVGDKLHLRIGNETPVLYEIAQIKPNILYIHKPGEASRLSALLFDGSKWTVHGLPSTIDLFIEPIGSWRIENIGRGDRVAAMTDEQIILASLEDPEERFFDERLWKRLSKERLPEYIAMKGRSEYGKYAGEDSGPSWKAFYYLMSKLKSIANAVEPKDRVKIMNVMKTLANYLIREPFVVIFTDPKYKKLIPHALQALVKAGNVEILKYMVQAHNVPLTQYNSQIVDALLPTENQEMLKFLLQNGVHLVQSDVDKLAALGNIELLSLLASYGIYPSLAALRYAYNSPKNTDDILVVMGEKYGMDAIYDPQLYDTAVRNGKNYVVEFFRE